MDTVVYAKLSADVYLNIYLQANETELSPNKGHPQKFCGKNGTQSAGEPLV